MTNQAVLCLTANEQLVHVGSKAWVPACGAVIQFPTPAMTPQISRWSDFADSPRR